MKSENYKRTLAKLICILLLGTSPIAKAEKLELQFTPDGSAILENSQLELLVNNKTGRADGIRGWKYKPTGYEMVDVLFRSLDAGGGHILGLLWDAADVDTFPSRTPNVGGLFVPLAAGMSKDERAIVLEQVAQGKYRLTRRIILRRDLAGVEVRFRLENLEDEPGGFALRLHNTFSAGARGQYQSSEDIIVLPGVDGILQWKQDLPFDQFQKLHHGVAIHEGVVASAGNIWRGRTKDENVPRLAENWLVQMNPKNGDGMVMFVEEKDLAGYYNHPNTTAEPFLKAQVLHQGESWQTSAFLGAFGGVTSQVVKAATPLFVATQPLALKNGKLTGEIYPMFVGKLRIFSDKNPDKILMEYEAKAMTPMKVSVKMDSDWMLEAVDRQGDEIGSVAANGKTTLFEPEFSYEKKERPKVTGQVYQNPDDEKIIRATIQERDFVIQCDWNESEAVKALAEKMALQLGVGMAWTPRYAGKMIAFGNVARSTTTRNAGLLKQSVDTEWPGKGHGAILAYDHFESTTKPLVLVAGSDDEGALAAAQTFYEKYVKDQPAAKGFDFWSAPVSELGMVWTRPRTARRLEKIEIDSARNEYDSAQVILTAYENLKDIKVSVDPLINEETGEPISEKFTTRYRKQNGPLSVRWAENYPLNASEGWPGTPDALLRRPVTQLPSGKSQVLWLTTLVAEDAKPGVYKSAIRVKIGEEEQTIPIWLTVHDFVLPRIGLSNEAYMDMSLMSPTHHLRASDIDRLISTLVEHRFNIISMKEPDLIRWHVSPEGKYKGMDTDFLLSNEDGTLLMDTTRFDWIQEMCDRYAKPVDMEFVVGILDVIGWPEGFSSFKNKLPDRFADKPERKGHPMQSYWAQEMLEMFRKHLERRGLKDRVMVKVGDEPPGFDWWWNELCQATIHSGLRFNTAFNTIDWKQAEKALDSHFDRFEPLYQQFNPEFAELARKAGKKVGWYNCGPPPRSSVGVPASELRSYYWQAAKYNLDFVARWGVQCWGTEGTTPENAWTFPHGHYHFLVYPQHPEKPAYSEQGEGLVDFAPLDSIRFELIRDGIEDADYVGVFRGLIAKAKENGHFEVAEQSEELLDTIWNEMFPTMNYYNPPYEELMAARLKITKAIENLQTVLNQEKKS